MLLCFWVHTYYIVKIKGFLSSKVKREFYDILQICLYRRLFFSIQSAYSGVVLFWLWLLYSGFKMTPGLWDKKKKKSRILVQNQKINSGSFSISFWNHRQFRWALLWNNLLAGDSPGVFVLQGVPLTLRISLQLNETREWLRLTCKMLLSLLSRSAAKLNIFLSFRPTIFWNYFGTWMRHLKLGWFWNKFYLYHR